MGITQYGASVVIALAIGLGGCSVVHSPGEFRQINERRSQNFEVAESFDSLRKRLQYQIDKCFTGFYRTNQGYGGDSAKYEYGATYESHSNSKGTFLITQFIEGKTIGITVGTSDSFAAIADLQGVSSQVTAVTVYARRKGFAKALRVWVKNESGACPRL